MTFSRGKPTGFVTGDRLTAAQINTIDLNQSRAIDGYEGGNYTPASSLRFMSQVVIGSTGYFGVESGGQLALQPGATATVASGATLTICGNTGFTLDGTLNYPLLSSRSVVRPLRGAVVPEVDSEWALFPPGVWEWQNVGENGIGLWLSEPLESGGVLTNVTVYLQCPTHGAVWPPQNAPKVTVSLLSLVTGVSTELAHAHDSLSQQSEYEAVHPISVPITTGYTWSSSEVLKILVWSEYGTNAMSAGHFLGGTCTLNFTSLRAV